MKAKCPSCKKASLKDGNKWFPFCSERCQLVDLGRWLDEEYRVPGEPADPEDIEAATPPGPEKREH